MKNIIKSLFCIVLSMIILCSLCACGNKKNIDKTNPSEFRPAPITDVTFSAQAYLIDNWRVDIDEATREYTYPILVYSDNYCAPISQDDVKYYVELDRHPFIEQYPTAKIQCIDFNQPELCKTVTLIIIKTDKIIDTKKISIDIDGFNKYVGLFDNKEEYVAGGGDVKNWCALSATLSTQRAPWNKLAGSIHDQEKAIMQLWDSNNSLVYVEKTNNLITESDSILREFAVTTLTKDCSSDVLAILNDDLRAAKYENGVVTKVDLPENIQIVIAATDNGMAYGFKTIDGTDIAPYLDKLPQFIVYNLDYTLILNIDF